ncbi:DUF58 domain-containing protein [Nocardioides sp. W3-2-3]|uniref:DUF58 domain-containing protein n=1 Tax=Nocardioides convexus TaxID=2712224 RepID=UPI0024182959|nr:DUF58 domain-containing protein [Nocardioides convexus]NHA00437.1 DUF58 domain-containing protein [Nocardioides convexus]
MPAHLPRIKARLSIHAHRKVRGLLEGEYAAVHVGRGIDFNDLREYVRGDDVKDIDWKASARSRQAPRQEVRRRAQAHRAALRLDRAQHGGAQRRGRLQARVSRCSSAG